MAVGYRRKGGAQWQQSWVDIMTREECTRRCVHSSDLFYRRLLALRQRQVEAMARFRRFGQLGGLQRHQPSILA